MEVQAKFKEIGKEWRNVKTLLPDYFGPFMEKYDLEIVNYSMFKSVGIFFINKIYPKDDIVSVTIKDPSISDNIKEGFKDAFESLQQYEADLLTTTQGVSGAVNDILTHNT